MPGGRCVGPPLAVHRPPPLLFVHRVDCERLRPYLNEAAASSEYAPPSGPRDPIGLREHHRPGRIGVRVNQ